MYGVPCLFFFLRNTQRRRTYFSRLPFRIFCRFAMSFISIRQAFFHPFFISPFSTRRTRSPISKIDFTSFIFLFAIFGGGVYVIIIMEHTWTTCSALSAAASMCDTEKRLESSDLIKVVEYCFPCSLRFFAAFHYRSRCPAPTYSYPFYLICAPKLLELWMAARMCW